MEGQQLSGTYKRLPSNPIIVWERSDGRKEVITGRHRLDLAKRTGETTIPAQVVREVDGFTRKQAMMLDAESNIREGQGEVADYVTFFGQSGISETAAREQGLLGRIKGRQA